MPKFKAHVQRFVEETATVEVEADSAEEAIMKARDTVRLNQESLQWGSGDDCEGEEVYALEDEAGEQVYTR